ncbi:hypothetical protein K443DRAFT_595854 [Laccaria amethystina LaAM-08-1]|uniref:Uncharacterized protein n=1 Tax=Laccaria amethystina LaAM-08-1 TaxID=1095629 RepID=A0A0C9XSK4_9AGAR|nr:hypothetical protein K443DRAFT_595854 [Laccaria amethystina LaAM-08-1]
MSVTCASNESPVSIDSSKDKELVAAYTHAFLLSPARITSTLRPTLIVPFAGSTTCQLSSFVPNQDITVDIELGVILGVCGRLLPFFLRSSRLGVMQLMRDSAVRGPSTQRRHCCCWMCLRQLGTSVITKGPSSHPRVHRHWTLAA